MPVKITYISIHYFYTGAVVGGMETIQWYMQGNILGLGVWYLSRGIYKVTSWGWGCGTYPGVYARNHPGVGGVVPIQGYIQGNILGLGVWHLSRGICKVTSWWWSRRLRSCGLKSFFLVDEVGGSTWSQRPDVLGKAGHQGLLHCAAWDDLER